MEDIKTSIKAFIVDNFLFGTTGSLEDDTSLLEEGIIDSSGVLELITFLEETYDITVDDEELIPQNLDSINNLTAFLNTKLVGNS